MILMNAVHVLRLSDDDALAFHKVHVLLTFFEILVLIYEINLVFLEYLFEELLLIHVQLIFHTIVC